MRITRLVAASAAILLTAAATVTLVGTPTAGAVGRAVTTQTAHKAGTTHLAGQSTPGAGELRPASGEDGALLRTPVANRSESSRAKSTRGVLPLSGIASASTAVDSAVGATSFSGIDHKQQRLDVAGGNQWSLEPPDQALCVGGGFIFEAVNNAVAVYDSSGARLALDSLNHFFGYPVEINRTTGEAGAFQTTDPTCLFDPGTGRFFLTILTYKADAAGNPLGPNTLDTAVSTTSDPRGTWTISRIDATDDGTGDTPSHPDCPCIGDYPHIGIDANGYYITTNEYPWFVDGFNGAQIYAMSKTALASGATAVRVEHYDTVRLGPGGNPGFTVWPAQSPTVAQYDASAGGTEYFMSTNAAEEANGTDRSSTVAVWSLTGTGALSATAGRPALHMAPVPVGEYAVPPPSDQKVGPVPLADCLNVTACAKLVAGTPDRYKESERPLDSLDSRMQQVDYANGLLYAAHGTALDVGSPAAQKAGIAWYIVDPTTADNGNLSATVTHQGRLATASNNLIMPAMGVRSDGSAVIGMTLAGADHYPSAAYVDLTPSGTTSTVHVLAEGVGPEDGFAGYRLFGGRPRWGDYGAAAVDSAGNMWMAAEWISQSCTFAQYTADPFGQCGGTRTALANWSTRISRVAPPS